MDSCKDPLALEHLLYSHFYVTGWLQVSKYFWDHLISLGKNSQKEQEKAEDGNWALQPQCCHKICSNGNMQHPHFPEPMGNTGAWKPPCQGFAVPLPFFILVKIPLQTCTENFRARPSPLGQTTTT